MMNQPKAGQKGKKKRLRFDDNSIAETISSQYKSQEKMLLCQVTSRREGHVCCPLRSLELLAQSACWWGADLPYLRLKLRCSQEDNNCEEQASSKYMSGSLGQFLRAYWWGKFTESALPTPEADTSTSGREKHGCNLKLWPKGRVRTGLMWFISEGK